MSSTPDLFTLLSDFTDSVDSLPHELIKAFGELRELDAVLRSETLLYLSDIQYLM